jgi:hypothetical protein
MTSLAGMPEDSGGRFAGKVLKAGVVAGNPRSTDRFGPNSSNRWK